VIRNICNYLLTWRNKISPQTTQPPSVHSHPLILVLLHTFPALDHTNINLEWTPAGRIQHPETCHYSASLSLTLTPAVAANKRWLPCPSLVSAPPCPLLSSLYLDLSSLSFSFSSPPCCFLSRTHTSSCSSVVLVLSDLLIDILRHKRRQSQSSVEPLLPLIEWTERWRRAIDSTDWEREKEEENGRLWHLVQREKRRLCWRDAYMLGQWMDRWWEKWRMYE